MARPDIEISAFAWVPDFAQGYVRDIRPRWALEEAGLPYRRHLVTGTEKDSPEYRAWQPFGQVPAYRDGEVELFESGSILLRIAERSDVLRPWDETERAKITTWVIASLNSMEPQINNVVLPALFNAGEPWLEGWLAHARKMAAMRLASLAGHLQGRDWLADRFSVADIVMATVLRQIEGTELLAAQPVVESYLDRCLARPAFRRAVEAQIADFSEKAA